MAAESRSDRLRAISFANVETAPTKNRHKPDGQRVQQSQQCVIATIVSSHEYNQWMPYGDLRWQPWVQLMDKILHQIWTSGCAMRASVSPPCIPHL